MKAKAQCRFSIYIGPLLYTTEPWTVFDDTLVRPGHSGGGVYFTGNDPSLLTLNIKGATKIGDNIAPKAENLYLLNIALPGSTEEGSAADEFQTVLTVSDGLTTAGDQAEIGIYMDKPGVFTSGYSKQCGEVEPSIYFKRDHSDYLVEWSAEKNEATL